MNLLWIAAVVLLAASAQAHIKLFFQPWQLPIRNAPGLTSDGTFSAMGADPCGGARRWGKRNGRVFSKLVDGQKVCLRANWNGGHFITPSVNFLNLVWYCEENGNAGDYTPFEGNMDRFTGGGNGYLSSREARYYPHMWYLPLVNGTDPAPLADGITVDGRRTNLEYDGYTLCANLPEIGLNGTDQSNRCMISVIEGQGWGNCVDFITYAKPEDYGTVSVKTAAPMLTDTQFAELARDPVDLINSEGSYEITQCLTDAGGKCCLRGHIGVNRNGAVSARLMGNGGQSTCGLLATGQVDYQMVLQLDRFSSSNETRRYTTHFLMHPGVFPNGVVVYPQNISLTLTDGGSIELVNVDLDVPTVADHLATFKGPLDRAVLNYDIAYPVLPSDSLPWNLIAGVAITGFFVVYLCTGVCCAKAAGRGCVHPHVLSFLIWMGMARDTRLAMPGTSDDPAKEPLQASSSSKGKVYSVQLPKGWVATVDGPSEEVYYYNEETKAVQWERPT